MHLEPEEFLGISIPVNNPNAINQDEAIRPEQIHGLKQNVGKGGNNPGDNGLDNISNQNTTDVTNKVRTDNTRKTAFIFLMMFLKVFFLEEFDLDFQSFKCDEVFGNSIRNFKRVLKLKIYQILCYYPINAIKLLKFLDRKMTKNKRIMFFYFMTRTYEELYIRYINGNIDFPIIPNGTVRICKFMTLKKAINTKNKKGENKIKNVEEFIHLSKNMLADFKTKGRTKDEYVDKPFITFEIGIFEKMRDNFNEEALASGMELEE